MEKDKLTEVEKPTRAERLEKSTKARSKRKMIKEIKADQWDRGLHDLED